MSTVAYATQTDLSNFLSEEVDMPTDADRLLQRASDRIDDFVIATFDTDATTKMPTNEAVAVALRDAACAQVEFWLEVGEGHDIDGVQGQMQIVGGANYQLPEILASRARSILNRANLMNLGWVGV